MTSPLVGSDPTAALLLPPPKVPAIPVRYRSGRVVAFNQRTGANTIKVDEVTLTNVNVQPGPWVGVVKVDDFVSMVSTTDERGITTYAITGLIVGPPDIRVGRLSGLYGYTHEHRDFGYTGTVDAPNPNFGVMPGFSTPGRITLASPESLIEVKIEGTLYGAGGSTGFDIGALVNGGDYVLGGIHEANATSNAHTGYSFTGLIPNVPGTTGQLDVYPRWRNISGSASRMDAGDFMSMTVTERFVR